MADEKLTNDDVMARVTRLTQSLPPAECWQRVTQHVLKPDHPFELHKRVHEMVFADWDDSLGPAPAWIPSEEFVQTTNIAELMRESGFESYEELHKWSVTDRAGFWRRMIADLEIRFAHPIGQVMDQSASVESPRWLPGAKLNIADSCFRAPGDSVAVLYQKEDGPLSTLTYDELEALTNRVANGLVSAGFELGDALAIAMPMTAESVAIYLGIVKAGCVVVSIADSFAPPEIETRLLLGGAKGVFTQDYVVRGGKSLPLYEKVVAANAPQAIVLPCADALSVGLRDEDVSWDAFLSDCTEFLRVPRNPDDHTNVLFSSGTTGEPKTIPWTQTTPIKCAADGRLHQNIQPDDVVGWPTNIGWMMGPWLIYASLLSRATVALYYGAPTGRPFGEFVQNARVTMLGVVPSLVRAWRNTECMRGLDWSALKAFSSTGECSNAEDMLYLMSLAGYRPVIEYCGGTEIGGGYITGTVVQPAAPATFSTPALGLRLLILDEDGRQTDNGEVFLVPPSMGLSQELLHQDHDEVYFEGTPAALPDVRLRRHGDQIEAIGGGYYRAHGRVDDTMNLGGIKVSSAEIETAFSAIPGVRETAAISVSPPGGGPGQLVVYTVPLAGAQPEREALKASMQQAIREGLNPLFKVHDVVIVDELPRTASNKVMRRTLRAQYAAAAKERPQ